MLLRNLFFQNFKNNTSQIKILLGSYMCHQFLVYVLNNVKAHHTLDDRAHVREGRGTRSTTVLLFNLKTTSILINGVLFSNYSQTSKEYQQEYDMRRGSEYSRFHGYTYDGVWTAALAIQEVARKVHQSSHDKGTLNRTIADFQYRDPEWENLFLQALRDTSFEGVTVMNSRVELLGSGSDLKSN